MNDQRLASLIGEWLTARGLHRSAEQLKAEAVALSASAARTPPTELDSLLSKLSKGDTYYKPPPNIFVKPRPRDVKRLFRMIPLPEVKDEWQDDDDAGFRKISGRDAELAFQQEAATAPAPVVAAHPAPDAAPKEKDPAESAAAPTNSDHHATPSAATPAHVEDETIPKHFVEANLPPTPDGSATVNPAAVVDEDPFERFDLKIIHAKRKTGFEESKDFPIKLNSIIAGRYQILEYIGSAAFSKAVQCLDMSTGELVCIKIIKNNKDFFDQSLDEIKLLKYINAHAEPDAKNVVQLYDYFYFKEHLFIVCELLRDNLYEFYKYNRESGDEPYFTLQRLQKITRQCLVALDYVHGLGLIHCDLKPENILIKSYSRCEVKVIDFGSSCFTTDHLSSYVQSRSYRAPEVLLGLPYGQKIDLWSLGCILAELWTGNVLFLNDSIVTLLARIVGIIGPFPKEMLQAGRYVQKYFTPEGRLYERDDEKGTGLFYLLPKRTNLKNRLHTEDKYFVDFIRCLLRLNPEERPTAAEALEHPFLRDATYEGNVRKQQS